MSKYLLGLDISSKEAYRARWERPQLEKRWVKTKDSVQTIKGRSHPVGGVGSKGGLGVLGALWTGDKNGSHSRRALECHSPGSFSFHVAFRGEKEKTSPQTTW